MMNETLIRAQHAADAVCNELRTALANGGAVDALLLLPLIRKASELRNDVLTLLNARCDDGRKVG